MSTARPRKISQIKPLFGNLAQTSHYQVSFGGLSRLLESHLTLRGIDWRFVAEDAGLLCSSTSLPGSSLATTDIVNDVTGVTEKMAHTRMFNAIDLTFYVDKEYKMIKFLEHWIEFIAGGSRPISSANKGYFFRMKYPKDYMLVGDSGGFQLASFKKRGEVCNLTALDSLRWQEENCNVDYIIYIDIVCQKCYMGAVQESIKHDS